MEFPKYDCHLHTHFSPCGTPEMTAQNIFQRAEEIGLTGLCLTDHLHAFTNFDQFHQLRQEILQADHRNLSVWIGCEVNVLGPGRYSITPEQAKKFDMTVAAPMHWLKEVDKPDSLEESVFAEFIVRMLTAALDCPHVKIIAHPLLMPGDLEIKYDQAKVLKYLIDSPNTTKFLHQARSKNIAIEISPKYIFGPLHDLVVAFYRRCLEENVLLALNSDGHALHMMNIWDRHARFLNILGVTSSNQLWMANNHLPKISILDKNAINICK
jgi:histidinol phosphatase-like PHP family hydrolase